MEYRIIKYESWIELKGNMLQDLFYGNMFPGNRYVFRGQMDEGWSLCSSFDRKYGKFEFKQRQKIEEQLINNFKDLCVTWEGKGNFRNYSKEQLMSIGQHYGLPTRLLDWSYSLYIAAFFAYSNNEGYTDNVAIWMLDTEHEVWNAGYGISIVHDRVDENERQKYQYGLFTNNNSPSSSIEEYLRMCGNSGHKIEGALSKIILPSSERKYVLNDLEMMGINSYNLCRGLDGCAYEAVVREYLTR
jgi:hypothetical protein